MFGMALMLTGIAISWSTLPPAFTALYGICIVMSVLYSVPPFRWKAVAGLDIAINAIGIGTLTALAGWLLAEVPLERWSATVLAGFAPLFAALYPLTQLYQVEEDIRRGDHTFAIALGMRRSLQFALAMTILAFLLIGTGLAMGPAGLAASLVAVPATVWIVLLVWWLREYPDLSPARHKSGMYRALQAWALTDVAVAAAVIGPALLQH